MRESRKGILQESSKKTGKALGSNLQKKVTATWEGSKHNGLQENREERMEVKQQVSRQKVGKKNSKEKGKRICKKRIKEVGKEVCNKKKGSRQESKKKCIMNLTTKRTSKKDSYYARKSAKR